MSKNINVLKGGCPTCGKNKIPMNEHSCDCSTMGICGYSGDYTFLKPNSNQSGGCMKCCDNCHNLCKGECCDMCESGKENVRSMYEMSGGCACSASIPSPQAPSFSEYNMDLSGGAGKKSIHKIKIKSYQQKNQNGGCMSCCDNCHSLCRGECCKKCLSRN